MERLLGGYEPRPIAAELKRMGEGTDQVLIEIALDERAAPLRRLRALHALGHVPTDAGRDHCRRVIRDEGGAGDGMEVLHVAACAETLGEFGETTVVELASLLAHPSAEVRHGATRGLLRTASTNAVRALRQRLPVEPHPSVRATIVRALRDLERK